MAVEAQRRVDAQRFTVELALPLSAGAPEEEEEATGRVTIGGFVFEGAASAVVVDAVGGSAAAEEPRLRAAAGGAVLVRVNRGVVDGKSCHGSLERALASTTRNTVELQFDAQVGSSGGGGQKPVGGRGGLGAAAVDSRTSIAWNSQEEDAAAAATASGASSAASDEADEMMLEAAVPEGALPGTVILVLAPTGQRVEVTVPEGAEPGSLLRVVVPAAAALATPRETSRAGPSAASADSGDPGEEFASALEALQAGEYASAVAHFEAVLALGESEGGPRHDEARSGLAQARRGVTLSGLGSEQLQQMLEQDGMHQHLGLAEAEADGAESRDGSASSRDSGTPQSPAPAAGLRSWLPKGRKSARKIDEVY